MSRRQEVESSMYGKGAGGLRSIPAMVFCSDWACAASGWGGIKQ